MDPWAPGIFGLLGSMTHQFKSDSTPAAEGSNTSLAAGGGVNVGFPLGSILGFLEGWFLTGFGDNDTTQLFGVTAGVGIPVGGGGM